jgi:hypothetical protein
LEFGKYAEENAKRNGKKPSSFDFLGFTHYCSKSRKGQFRVNGCEKSVRPDSVRGMSRKGHIYSTTAYTKNE